MGCSHITERRAASPGELPTHEGLAAAIKPLVWYWVIVTVVVLGFVALRAMVSNRSGGWWVVLRWLLNGILLFIGLFALLLLVMARNLGEF